MRSRIRLVAVVGAVLLTAAAAVPVTRAADRLIPHAIVLWDIDECAPSTAARHTILAVAGPVLPPGHGDVQILDAHPLGLSEGAHWRAWIVPVPKGGSFTGALAVSDPPPGWPDRRPAGGATVSSSARTELDLELWPGAGVERTSLRGFLVTYRTTFGVVRTVWSPTEVSTRAGGCT